MSLQATISTEGGIGCLWPIANKRIHNCTDVTKTKYEAKRGNLIGISENQTINDDICLAG
jgi:hypothetical protein